MKGDARIGIERAGLLLNRSIQQSVDAEQIQVNAGLDLHHFGQGLEEGPGSLDVAEMANVDQPPRGPVRGCR